MRKMNNPEFDLLVKRDKIQSCFSFPHDVKVGEVGEKFVEAIFSSPDIKLEVKKDDWTVKTGNIAIEFECRGKPSGILVTRADFWCHVIGHYFVLVFPVDFLKFIQRTLSTNPKYVKEMGDRNKEGGKVSKAILIPWKELIQRFKDYGKFVDARQAL